MLPNVSIKPNISTSQSIIGSRAYTFLDSYVYMKNQRYNAFYEKNKQILAIENNAISIKSANVLYNAFMEEARMLDSIVIRIRNFALRIKPDVIENINILVPDYETISLFDNAISTNQDIPRMKYIHYDIKPIVYENMASFINLYRMEINTFTSIKTQTANKGNPFIKDKAAKYLINTAMQHANSATELLEMESIKIMNLSKLKSISEFFKHKNKFISTITRDFKTFQFYLRQYSGLREITSLMKPTEMSNGNVLVNGSSKPITFNDYFVLYKHFNSMIRYMINIISYHEQQFFNKIYALQSNIENYISIMNDVIEFNENNKPNENDSLTESIVFSKDDVYKNFDKFESGESNILLVTGLTGSGKSTIGKEIASKYKAEWIELDILDPNCGIALQGLDIIKEAGEVFYDYFMSHKDIYEKYNNKELKGKDLSLFVDDFIKYCFSWCKKHNDKKFVIEGIQIFDYYTYYNLKVEYPIIIKGTSVLKSFIRKIKREEWTVKNVLLSGPKCLKMMVSNDKDIKSLIDSLNESYENNDISYDSYIKINESVKNKRVNDKGENVPEKCTKCCSDIKVFLKGEPVWLCTNENCKKYYGTLPCNLNEAYDDGLINSDKIDAHQMINGNDAAHSFLYDTMDETKSSLNTNYKPKGKLNLSSLRKERITSELIDKFKSEYPFLKHVRCKDTDTYVCDGYIWFKNDKLVCMVGSCKYTDDNTKWIVSLEIMKEYKGYGLSSQIVDFAVKELHCNYLSVNKNNEIALKVYEKYGFKTYHEDKNMFYMKLKNTINESIDELYMILNKQGLELVKGKQYSDSIQDVDDESISNFNEYDGIPEEGNSICTLRDSLKV